MGALQPIHWVVILVVVLIVFGAGKLPDVLGQVGRGVRTFRDEVSTGESERKSATSPDHPKSG